MTIPSIPFVKEQVRAIDETFLDLINQEIAGTITPARKHQLDLMCAAKEAGQDDWLVIERLPCGGVVL